VSPAAAAVLLVDDRPENLMALEAILEPLGYDLVRAGSGDEALRQVLLREFAVILLDVQMPGMNGFETAQLIKSRERSRYTPIIFLTAISKDEAFVYEGYSVGAVDYMFKPFNPDVLRSKVGVFVDLFLKTEQLKEQEQRLREVELREVELQHRAALLESEARMAAVVGSAMDAIVTFDDRRRITLFNRAAERMFGLTAREAVGRPLDDLLHPDHRGRTLADMCADAGESAASVHGEEAGDVPGHPREYALVGERAGGDAFPMEASISCLRLENERVFTVIARDVSERKRAEEALRRQAAHLAATSAELKDVNEELTERQQELENAISSRSRFYASMSHELRTPINAILGYSALLLDGIYGPLNPEQARGIDRANAAAKHLLELVNDILDLSKMEAGKIDLEVQPAVFPGLLEDLFVTVRPLADEHGSTLALETLCERAEVVTDPRRVRQILLNLLSNAIKFGDGKPITVGCDCLADGGVEVTVADQGRGIAPEDQEKIFDEFVQLADADHQQGTGLGLPISRRLAELLGGSLTVKSEPGEGSEFRLVLPPRMDLRAVLAEPPPLAAPDPPADLDPEAGPGHGAGGAAPPAGDTDDGVAAHGAPRAGAAGAG
jgi:PAS domain S-box-containing protein